MKNKTIITFYSTHNALRSEKILNDKKISCELIPVPEGIEYSCGLAARVKQGEIDKALYTLTSCEIVYSRAYKITPEKNILLAEG